MNDPLPSNKSTLVHRPALEMATSLVPSRRLRDRNSPDSTRAAGASRIGKSSTPEGIRPLAPCSCAAPGPVMPIVRSSAAPTLKAFAARMLEELSDPPRGEVTAITAARFLDRSEGRQTNLVIVDECQHLDKLTRTPPRRIAPASRNRY
jgi:hypothetical protein